MPDPKKAPAFSQLRWLLLLPIPVLWCVLSHVGALDFLENRFTDYRFRARGELSAPVKLVYVNIDNDAIQAFKWPWNHARFAQLLDALFDLGKIKAAGIDIVFSENARADFGLKEQNEGRIAREIHTPSPQCGACGKLRARPGHHAKATAVPVGVRRFPRPEEE